MATEQSELRPVMRLRRATPIEEQFGRDLRSLHEHMNAWKKEFGPEKWVAVYEEQRVALADSLDEMFGQVETGGHPKNRVVFAQLCE